MSELYFLLQEIPSELVEPIDLESLKQRAEHEALNDWQNQCVVLRSVGEYWRPGPEPSNRLVLLQVLVDGLPTFKRPARFLKPRRSALHHPTTKP